MKTVCPHCHQKYDVPDDYLQQDVTCQKCEKDFTVTKAKFCSECGKANPAQAFQCYACLHPFRLKIYTETEDAASQHLISNASGDRSEAKLGLLLQIIVFIYGVGSGLAALQGVGMIFPHFPTILSWAIRGLQLSTALLLLPYMDGYCCSFPHLLSRKRKRYKHLIPCLHYWEAEFSPSSASLYPSLFFPGGSKPSMRFQTFLHLFSFIRYTISGEKDVLWT